MKKFVLSLCALGLVVASLGVVSAELLVNQQQFTDDDGAFYMPYVHYLSDMEVVEGYDDGSFGYELTVNRAEMLKILIKGAFGTTEAELGPWLEYVGESCFDDVKANKWYTGYVCYAKAQEWIEGYDDNTFKPGQDVNFVEAMKMLLEVFGIDYDTGTTPWYRGLVEAGAEDNLIPLTVDSFDHEITRGEMSGMAAMSHGIFEACDEDGVKDTDPCRVYNEYISNYVMTYEMVEFGDSYWMEVEGGTEEPGLSVSMSTEALVKSDCGGYKCFEEKFEACEPSELNMNLFVISYTYEILGMEDGLCRVKSYYDDHFQEDWIGKEMVCRLESWRGFQTSIKEMVEGLENIEEDGLCEGELVDMLIDLAPGDSCEDDDGEVWDDGTKLNVPAWDPYADAPIECVDGEWVDCPDCFEEEEEDKDMKLDILGYSYGANYSLDGYYVEITVEDADLDDGENYFAECVGGESSNDIYPNVFSEDTVMTIDDLQGGVEYSCYVQVSVIDTEWETSDHFAIDFTGYEVLTPTEDEELVITSYDVDSDSITLHVDGASLGVGENYHAKCIEEGQVEILVLSYQYPQWDAYIDSLPVVGLNNNTTYQCYAAIHDENDTMIHQTDSMTITTDYDADQLQIMESYSGYSDLSGWYIVIVAEALDLADNESYFVQCWDETFSVDVDLYSDDPNITMVNLDYNTVYICTLNAGSQKPNLSEYIIEKTPPASWAD